MPLPVLWTTSSLSDASGQIYQYYSVAPLDSGGYVFAGLRGGSAVFEAFDAAGYSAGPFTVLEESSLGVSVTGASVARLDNGFAVAVSKVVDTGAGLLGNIEIKTFDVAGVPTYQNSVIAGLPSSLSSVKLESIENDRLFVTWTQSDGSSTGVFGSIADVQGQQLTGPFQINTTVAGQQYDIEVDQLPNGNLVCVYSDSDRIRARVIGQDGSSISGEFLVEQSLLINQLEPSVTALDNNTFVVSWYDSGSEDSKAQIFTANGLRLGGIIDIGIGEDASRPQVIAQPDGGFLAIYNLTTGPVSSLNAQAFSSNGQSLGTSVITTWSPSAFGERLQITELADQRLALGYATPGENRILVIDPRGAATINGTSGDDVLFGSSPFFPTPPKLIIGGTGNDVLYAGRGDTARGGAGDDILVSSPIGGTLPTADFSDATSGVVIDVNAGTASGASTGNDILFGVFTNIIGGSGNDIIAAFDQSPGNGATTLDGGAGDDVFRRLQFTKTIIGGDGVDTMDASTVSDGQSATPGVIVDLAAGTWIAHGLVGPSGRTVSAVENVIGTSDSDAINGNHLANVLDGGAGNDIINGGEGNDTLIGGADNDNLNGGDDVDTLSYAAATGAITITLAASSQQNVGGGQGSDIVSNIENLIGSSFNDLLNGDLLSNTIWGGNGDDRLFGNNEDDLLYGEAGHDQLIGGAGADTLVGGTGNDRYFVDGIQDEIVEVAGQGIDRVYATRDYTLDEGVDIEFLHVANNTGGLELTGNSAGNTIFGSISATVGDTLSGAGGADALYGQAGDDRLDGGSGIDSYFGGAGADVFVLQNTFAGRDLLRDFVDVDDELEVSRSVFGNFDNAGAVAAADWFVSNTTGRAADANDRFIYNSTIGYLYFDADGNGAGARVLVARITNLEAIAAANFIVVA
jgi:Ca2+-binding RTX toxin-like protein